MKNKLLILLIPLVLSSCSIFNRDRSNKSSKESSSETESSSISYSSEDTTSNEEESTSSSEDSSSQETTSSSESISFSSSSSCEQSSESSSESMSSSEEEEDLPFDYIAFSQRSYDVVLGKKATQLIVEFYGDKEISIDDKQGEYTSSNIDIATIDQYGRVAGVMLGKAVISFQPYIGGDPAYCTVNVIENTDGWTREYLRVDDIDSIQPGDEIILASPAFNAAAGLTTSGRFLNTTTVSFSSDKSKITNYSDDVAEYYVEPGEGESFILEAQNNKYLAGRYTTAGGGVYYSKNGKDQIEWIMEKPSGYDEYFIVNDNIEESYWLMFNNDSTYGIVINLYDSNETALMKKPTVYRETAVK